MADKSIGELVAATSVGATDLFVLEQNNTAKKLTGQTLENWLVSFADGHGGIHSLVKTSSSGTNPVIDTYTITYADQTTSTFQVKNGVKGDKGDSQYVHIKYSSAMPTKDSDMYDTPDNYIGIYSGASSTAPTAYTSYTWFKYKGEKGDIGTPATITSQAVEYQAGTSGTIIPSGTWTTTIPTVPSGSYLWTKTTVSFNSGSPVISYSVARMGIDGSGSVSTVNNVSPDSNGNITIDAEGIGAEPAITTLPISKGGTGSTTAQAARTALEITPANIGALSSASGAVAAKNLGSNAVETAKIKDAAVTRAKLAQNALYSPMITIASNRNVLASDLGVTIIPQYNSSATEFTLTLNQTISTALPTGFEFATVYSSTQNKLKIATSGIRVLIAGEGQVADASHAKTFTIPEIGGMVAFKKISTGTTAGDQWVATGNMEVVS